MFAIIKDPEFTHEVKVYVPVDDGHQEHTFRARFRVMPPTSAGDVFELGSTREIRSFLQTAVVAIEDVTDEVGKPLKSTPKLIDQLLDMVFVRNALMRTYINAIVGARVGNSVGSAEPGPTVN